MCYLGFDIVELARIHKNYLMQLFWLMYLLTIHCNLVGSLHDMVKWASDRTNVEYYSLEVQGWSMVEHPASAHKQVKAIEWNAQMLWNVHGWL
jgi:hypothetical protein